MAGYCDSSFVVRLYLDLPESAGAQAVLESYSTSTSSPPLPVLWVHRLEVINALQWMAFFGKSGGPRVTPEQAGAAHQRFVEDCTGATSPFRLVSPGMAELERQFEELSLRHTASHGFRTYDLLHVSSALLLHCDTFWSFDSKANRLAALEGLKVLPARVRG